MGKWHLYLRDIYSVKKRRRDAQKKRRVDGVQVEPRQCVNESHTHAHTPSLAHHGCLNPHSPPQNHRIVSRGWQSQGFSTYKHFFSSNLPNASFKDVHVFYLVTSWRQRPRLPRSELKDADSTLKWRALSENKCLSDTFQPGFRWFCWLHMLRFCFKLIYANHRVLNV